MKSRGINNEPIQTLRISDRDKAKLLWAIEESSRQAIADNNRRLRVTCTNADAVLTLIDESTTRTDLCVLLRDLSRWGASVVHGRYVYPGTRCELEITKLDGSKESRAGEIGHIRHVQGLIHNLGVEFEEPIDLSEYVVLSPDEETRHYQELADDMPKDEDYTDTSPTYKVMVVDDFPSDRKLFSYWLGRAGMEVSTAADAKAARERIEESQLDLLIVDIRLGADSGLELINKMRNSQFVAPIIAVSANDDEDAKDLALNAGANAFLRKPFEAEELVECAHGLIGVNDTEETGPLFSAFSDEEDMRPLLSAFTRGLSDYIQQLHQANATNDYETLEEISRTLKGAGAGYGLGVITDQAAEVLLSLNDQSADMDAIRRSVNSLVRVLSRVKLKQN